VNWRGCERRAVFILGAGATRGALPHVVINKKRVKAPLNADFFKVVETFLRANDGNDALRTRYKRIRKVFQEEFPTRGHWPIGMEEAFSLLYVSKDFPKIYRTGPGRRRQAGSRIEIEDFLRLTFLILTAIEAQTKSTTLYDSLVAKLGPQDCVITLNYDTLLDSALVRSGWDPCTGYCLTGGSNKIEWQMQRPNPSPRLKNIRLLKLHGSLNWYVRGSFRDLSAVFQKKPTKVRVSQMPRVSETNGYIRQIVPPIYGKFFGHNQWQVLWDAAHEALLRAQIIIVIGCSLVDTDFHLRGMMGHAIHRRKQSGAKLEAVAVVSGTRTRRKWLSLLKGAYRESFEYPGFASFAQHHLT